MRRRNDGRSLNQLRNIKIKTGIDHSVDGSCAYNQGLTEVICFIRGPRARTQNNLIVIDYSSSPFSNIDAKRNSSFDKEYSMFAENLRESFENLVLLDERGKSEILINVCVIQNDGSSKSAVFNAVTIALLDAGVRMRDFLVSVNVGLYQGDIVVDMTNEEQKDAQGDLTISYQQRQSKVDYYELKTLKLNSNEVLWLSELAQQKAEEVYKTLRNDIICLKRNELI